MSKRLASAIFALLFALTAFVPALAAAETPAPSGAPEAEPSEKEEVIYFNLDASGEVESAYAVNSFPGGEITDYGVEAVVTSFGVPGFSPDTRTTRADNTHGVNLEVMLTNGALKNFDFDITDQMAQQPRGGVITVSGLTVSREEAAVESGFDVVVDGWGEYEDIEMPLN